MAIELYPAVDMLGGKAVRLHQGDFARTTEYDADPCEAARRWIEQGARRLHVVDLDGARSGEPVNLDHLERIARLDVPVQYGGGLRSAPDVEAAIERGAARVVLGTAAFLDPDLLDQLVVSHRGRIAVGLDVKGGRVAVHGWQERIGLSPTDAVARLVAANVETIVYTKVDWDGTMQGADLRIASQLDAAAGDHAEILYSGGIGSIDDLRQLASLGLKRLTGVIVGKALYERRFTVPEALEVL
jgi:phosphoribosylformimino-5-aminoimidazole carboxamide ribotide isomerase